MQHQEAQLAEQRCSTAHVTRCSAPGRECPTEGQIGFLGGASERRISQITVENMYDVILDSKVRFIFCLQRFYVVLSFGAAPRPSQVSEESAAAVTNELLDLRSEAVPSLIVVTVGQTKTQNDNITVKVQNMSMQHLCNEHSPVAKALSLNELVRHVSIIKPMMAYDGMQIHQFYGHRCHGLHIIHHGHFPTSPENHSLGLGKSEKASSVGLGICSARGASRSQFDENIG